MTQVAIQKQVDAIKKVTEKTLKSKETTLKFLKDAGIIQQESPLNESKSKK